MECFEGLFESMDSSGVKIEARINSFINDIVEAAKVLSQDLKKLRDPETDILFPKNGIITEAD